MSSRRILIVEDEKLILKGWAKALEYAGYTVVTALTGPEALHACEENLFDLVVLDFFMPAMDGVELLGRIRKKYPLLRSIIVSGKLDSNIGEQEIAGMLRERVEADRFLHKPVSNDRLISSIEEILNIPHVETNWQDLANRSIDGSKSRIKTAKQASKELRKLPRRRRNKK